MASRQPLGVVTVLALGLAAASCQGPPAAQAVGDGGTDADAPACGFPLAFEAGGEGHASPLGAGPAEARAGRLEAADLPPDPTGLQTWAPGDFVLANDRIALVIEDAGPSENYDPWGGRPIGLARVQAGALVEPATFGEVFVLVNRETPVTQQVTVLNDGLDGQAAVVRAVGPLRPLPFFENIVSLILPRSYPEILTAIDYVLEPGSDHVDVHVVHHSPRDTVAHVQAVMHGFMFGRRMPVYAPEVGFDTEGQAVPWLGFVDDEHTSYAYSVPGIALGAGFSVSGFIAHVSEGYEIEPCGETRRLHARVTIGGPGLDGLLRAVARDRGDVLREVSGVVRNADGSPAPGARVHAERERGGYLTRTVTDALGGYALHVPVGAALGLTVHRRGDELARATVAADAAGADLALSPSGFVHVTVRDADTEVSLPARVQVLPTSGSPPRLPERFGDPSVTGGRLHVEHTTAGETTLPVPAGTWRVVVSRGYEYEIVDEEVQVAPGATVELAAALEHVVDTAGRQCADLHLHTHRSSDSGDDATLKVRAAVADGLEIPVRSEHEYVESFQPIIERLGLTAWAFGVGSIELTSMETWGHMGVLPLVPDPTRVNGGAPLWQRFPDADALDVPLETISPSEVFAAVRARPERPLVIINHPRNGPHDYFDHVGYDPLTGMVELPEDWDETFTIVEVFSGEPWLENRESTVRDWLSLLDRGRRVFAVGSSDSHRVQSSPVGYPRTCLLLGTDDPRELTPEQVRDAIAAGHATVSGGIYVDASVGASGPGDEATGVGTTALVRVRVQAASWVDVDSLEVIVDGQTVDTLDLLPGDADPSDPTVRFDADLAVPVAVGGSYVVLAAYGDAPLEPVDPGRLPFAATNPIFLIR